MQLLGSAMFCLQFILLGALAVGLAVFLLVYKKINPVLIKHRYKLLAVFCIFMFAVQLAVSLNMVPNVMYDHDKTLNAAIVWTLEGNSERFQLYNNYLHHYPHQMGISCCSRLFSNWRPLWV